MANYQILKADIDAKVYQNGKQEITGANLNSVLNAMVATLGAEYQFAGVATIGTNPGSPDAKVFYIANGKGTYTNFGGIEVTEDDVVVLYYDTEWHKVATGIASQAKLTELESKIETTNEELFAEHLVGVTAERESGYEISWRGAIKTNQNGSIYRKTVNSGEKYRITQPKTIGSTGQYLYAIYNSTSPSADTVLVIGPEFNAATTVDITIPAGGVLLVWGRVNNNVATVQKYEEYSRITALEQGAATKRLFLQYGNNGVKINQKYSTSYDIQYWLNKFGINNLMQLYAHGFIPNETPVVSQSNPATYTLSGSDWIGPYIMSALQNSTGGSFSFTGGCHGSNGDETGDPTAETLDVQVYADERNIAVGSSISCDDVRVVVKNRIRAGNTQGASGRYVLEEIVTYHFKDNKMFVSVCSEALENISVSTYYGMQMNNYSNSALFFGKTIKAGTFSPSTPFPEKCFLGIGIDASGRMCAMHMETIGLGCNEHTDTTKYCFTSYDKMYYSLVNPNNTMTVDGGDKFYWAGWYQFTDILKLDELTY